MKYKRPFINTQVRSWFRMHSFILELYQFYLHLFKSQNKVWKFNFDNISFNGNINLCFQNRKSIFLFSIRPINIDQKKHLSLKHHAIGSTFPPLKKNTLRIYSMHYCPYAERVRLVLAAKSIP